MKNLLAVFSLLCVFTACEKATNKTADSHEKAALEPVWNAVDSATAAKTWMKMSVLSMISKRNMIFL